MSESATLLSPEARLDIAAYKALGLLRSMTSHGFVPAHLLGMSTAILAEAAAAEADARAELWTRNT